LSEKSDAQIIADAIMSLVSELKRWNDAQLPKEITRERSEPELFRAVYDEKEREERETSESLSKLTPATGEALTVRRRRGT